MATPIGRPRPQPYTLPDLRRRPGQSLYTGRQDPVVTEAARSGSDPTTTAARCVTIAIWSGQSLVCPKPKLCLQ